MRAKTPKERGSWKKKVLVGTAIAGMTAAALAGCAPQRPRYVLVDTTTGAVLGAAPAPKTRAIVVDTKTGKPVGLGAKPAKRPWVPAQKGGFGASSQWPEILEIFRWDASKPLHRARIDLINEIASSARCSPADVFYAIKSRGTAWYHARALRGELSTIERQIPGAVGARLAKLKRQKERLETDIAVINILSAKRASREEKAAVIDLVNSVKSTFFTGKRISELAEAGK